MMDREGCRVLTLAVGGVEDSARTVGFRQIVSKVHVVALCGRLNRATVRRTDSDKQRLVRMRSMQWTYNEILSLTKPEASK
jgi:hypothetical protein